MLALVPARTGSQRVPDKNFRPLNGESLLSRAARVARDAGLQTVVTSDDPFRARSHVNHDAIIIDRPAYLARADTPMEDVLRHAVRELNLNDSDLILLLQPTSPLRSTQSTREFIKTFKGLVPECESAFSVTVDTADYWFHGSGGESQRLRDLLPQPYNSRRSQSRRPLFRENGLYYLFSVQYLTRTGTIVGPTSSMIETSPDEDLDVNDLEDWNVAERRIQ